MNNKKDKTKQNSNNTFGEYIQYIQHILIDEERTFRTFFLKKFSVKNEISQCHKLQH